MGCCGVVNNDVNGGPSIPTRLPPHVNMHEGSFVLGSNRVPNCRKGVRTPPGYYARGGVYPPPVTTPEYQLGSHTSILEPALTRQPSYVFRVPCSPLEATSPRSLSWYQVVGPKAYLLMCICVANISLGTVCLVTRSVWYRIKLTQTHHLPSLPIEEKTPQKSAATTRSTTTPAAPTTHHHIDVHTHPAHTETKQKANTHVRARDISQGPR